MKLTIEIDLDNDELQNNHDAIRDIISDAIDRLPDPLRDCAPRNLYDTNGNRCGTARIDA